MKNHMKLFWLLGTDDAGAWHQRIVRANSLAHADAWWRAQLDRDAEVALAQETLEGGVGALVDIEDRVEQVGAGHLFAVWVEREDEIALVPVVAENADMASAQVAGLNPLASVAAVVDAAPLLDVVARMRAIVAGQMEPDEDLAN